MSIHSAILWIAYILGVCVALAAPWTSPMPVAECLGTDAAVLILGAGFGALARL